MPDAFTVVTRREVESEGVLVHELALTLLDHDHEVIAASADCWARYRSPDWIWDDVTPPWTLGAHGTMLLDARMHEGVFHGNPPTVRGSEDVVRDGLVVHSREAMSVRVASFTDAFIRRS